MPDQPSRGPRLAAIARRLRRLVGRERPRPRVLAISSGGGHWVELLRLRPAFDGCDVIYATVDERYRTAVDDAQRFHVFRDVTRWDRRGLAITYGQIAALIARERPDVIVSTGALPGFFAMMLGKLAGARTIWVDSLANVEELSMSGRRAGLFADLWLTQWPDLARPEGPLYAGSVL